MICKFCGNELSPGAKFCESCGAKAETEEKTCPACGRACTSGAIFCRYCGADFRKAEAPSRSAEKAAPKTVKPAAPSGSAQKAAPKTAKPAAQPKAKPKKRGRGLLVLVLAALLAFVGIKALKGRDIVDPEDDFIMSEVGTAVSEEASTIPDKTPAADAWEFTGFSDMTFDPRSALSVETVTVGGENTACTLDCGVCICFDPYSVSDGEHTLTVASLGEQNDGEYQCAAYDFLLDGRKAELAGTARITVPYDPAWGDNVFVQYYNEESGSWEILFTQTDGNGNAEFYTDHFCTFAVFCNMVIGYAADASAEAGQIFRLYGDDPLNQKVWVDYGALAAYLRTQSPSTIRDTAGQSQAYFAEKALDTVGFYTSAADLGVKGAGSAALTLDGLDKVAGFAKSTSDVLGHFGAVVTVSKLMTEVYRMDDTVDYYEMLKDNQTDIASLALYAGSTLGAGSAAAFCNAAGIMLFVYTASDAAITSIDLKGSGTVPEFAYREFSTRYIVYNQKTGACYPRYVKDAWESASTEYRDTVNDIDLPCREASEYAEWKDFFDAVSRLKPDQIPDKIDNVLTQYSSLFWNLPKTDPDTLERFLANTSTGVFGTSTLAEDYSRPSDFKIKEYQAAFKADLYKWLRPYMQECLRSSYYAMLNDAFREAAELQEQFNAQLRFVLRDPGVEDFAESPYAQYANTLSGTQSGEIRYDAAVGSPSEGWRFTKENGYSVSCTYLSYLLWGTPKYLRVQNGDSDVLSLEILPTCPETVIELGQPSEPQGDYLWTLTDVWYGDRSPGSGGQDKQYPLRLYAIYNNGDGILTPFEYAYEIVFDEQQLGFTISLQSFCLSSSRAVVSSPGRLVRSARDFVFTASSSDFTVDTSLGTAAEASAPYFEVMVQNSKGSVYYLTDGGRAQIPGGALSAETIKDTFYDSGMELSGELLIPDPEEDTVGQKVLFDTYGVCFLYTVLPADKAAAAGTEIHHGEFWAISMAEDALE